MRERRDSGEPPPGGHPRGPSPGRSGLSSGASRARLIAAFALAACGCKHTTLIDTKAVLGAPIAGSGDAAVMPGVEAHVGTTGILDKPQLTDLGVGVGGSHRVRVWPGWEPSWEIGPQVFHLSHRDGRLRWSSRAAAFVGLVGAPDEVGRFLLSGQLSSQVLIHFYEQPDPRPTFVSLGATLDVTRSMPDGGVAFSIGASVGYGFAWRTEE